MPPPAPRSLADELRGWDDDALADLLQRRPDLAAPPPSDLSTLATAAAGRLSVARAVDGLDAATLQVLEILAVLPEPATPAEVARRCGTPAGPRLDHLRSLALVWGGARSLRLVRAARDVLGPYPAGLGPPLAEALGRRSPQRIAELLHDLGLPPAGDPEQALTRLAAHLGEAGVVQELLEEAPSAARAVLERLAWGPPVGQVEDADRQVRPGTAGSAVEWLLAHGLLAVVDAGHVVLPREVGLVLRGGRIHRTPSLAPPTPATRVWPATQVAAAAATAAAEAVRAVEELGRCWADDPPARLRSGGLAVREMRRLATILDVDDATAALLVEVAAGAGLVADDAEITPRWLPTGQFDAWLALPMGDRWVALAAGWLSSTRAASLVGQRVARVGAGRDAPLAALSPDLERPLAPQLRREVLTALAEIASAASVTGPGEATVAGLQEPAGLIARLDWFAPRRTAAARVELALATLTEAARLGFTGLGALPPAGALVLAEQHREAAAALEQALPPAVNEILLQADLTAVAPGRLEPALGRQLDLLADVESRGAATVYRFSMASVRRALDAGRTADDVLALLAAHSRTPVPQPLEYLVTDTARRHGLLRVGTGGAYLRADDEAALAELLADRRAAGLGLRRLAPTVLVAQSAPDAVLATLRSMGLAPAAEGPTGEILVHRRATRRAAAPAATVLRRPTAPRRADLLHAVRAMRAVVEHARRALVPPAVAPELVPMEPQASLALISDAVAARRDVWIGYLSETGRAARHVVEPLSVDAGRVRALDRETGVVRTYSVHRLIGVAPAT